jgi:hypothetical protein
MYASKDRFVPPDHPNWTGRAHRSRDEAYGRAVPLHERWERRIRRQDLVLDGVIALALVALLAILCH